MSRTANPRSASTFPNRSDQLIAIGPDSSSDPLIGSLSFCGQFRLMLISFSIQTLELSIKVCNSICQVPLLGGVPVRRLAQARWRMWYSRRI